MRQHVDVYYSESSLGFLSKSPVLPHRIRLVARGLYDFKASASRRQKMNLNFLGGFDRSIGFGVGFGVLILAALIHRCDKNLKQSPALTLRCVFRLRGRNFQ